MRILVVAAVSLMCVSGGAAGGGVTSDAGLARSLVVARAQVPSSWDSTIVPNPCPVAARPGSSATARAATRWGSLNRGIWSVATVGTGPASARALFDQAASDLPTCVVRALRAGFAPPGAQAPSVRLARRPIPPLGDGRAAWRAIVTHTLDGRPARFELDVILVRTGRAVAFYLFTWNDGLPTIRRLVGQAG